nr:unnamed protein product [Callosobruchus chinensis]
MGAASRQRSSPLLIRSSRFFYQKRHSNASAPPLQPGPGPQRLSSLSTIIEVPPQGQPIRRRRGGATCHDTGAEVPIFRGLQGVLPIVDPTVAPVHRARGRLLRGIIT